MRIGSLFSGYGGLDMAARDVLGGELAWVADIEPGPRKLLAHRHPTVPNLGDVTAVDWATVEPVDIICGGSPCQDLSTAGRRAGMRPGTRSGLWESMREAIATIQPTYVTWENVRGALSAEAHSDMVNDPGLLGDGRGRPVLRALGRVLGDLADLGFDAEWRGLRAADVGAPHQRYRIFLLARRRGHVVDTDLIGGPLQDRRGQPAVPEPGRTSSSGRAMTLLPTPIAVSYGNNQSQSAGAAVRPSLDSLAKLLPTPRTSDTNGAGAHGAGGLDLRTTVTLLPTPRSTRGGSTTEISYAFGGERTDDGRPQGEVLLPTPRATDGTKGGPNQRGSSGDLMLPSAVQPSHWGDYAAAIARWETIAGPAPSPTEPGRNGPRLSPAFTEWMMGLPPGWITSVPGITRTEALRMCGNGVVPQQAAAAVRDCLTAFKEAA